MIPLLPFLLLMQSLDSQLLRLPSLQVKDDGPRQYRFVCDYFHLDLKGNLSGKQRVSAEYTRGLPEGKVRWNNVTVANAKDLSDEFPPGQKRAFMEDFTYAQASLKDATRPEFFRGFPPSATQEKNLVWDVQMLEMFGQNYFDKLELNRPYRLASGQVPLAGAGNFQNKELELTWLGLSRRNGQTCALLRYTALFNRLQVTGPGLDLTGRSHYWGEIWVSLSTKQIEYATLLEDVLGEMKMGEPATVRPLNVFRKAVFERISAGR